MCLSHKETEYCDALPSSEQFERYVLQQFGPYCDLYPSAERLRLGWFGSGAPDPRLLQRIGDYVLIMKLLCHQGYAARGAAHYNRTVRTLRVAYG
jgi:hypothetical protein